MLFKSVHLSVMERIWVAEFHMQTWSGMYGNWIVNFLRLCWFYLGRTRRCFPWEAKRVYFVGFRKALKSYLSSCSNVHRVQFSNDEMNLASVKPFVLEQSDSDAQYGETVFFPYRMYWCTSRHRPSPAVPCSALGGPHQLKLNCWPSTFVYRAHHSVVLLPVVGRRLWPRRKTGESYAAQNFG